MTNLDGINLIPLDKVIIDNRARSGFWCTLPYPNHPKGCPNYGKKERCPPSAIKFEDLMTPPYTAIIFEFNLKEHAKRMKEKHTHWSERQCRNPLYWQNSVRSKLKKFSEKYTRFLKALTRAEYVVSEIPEANGVNVFATMAYHGIYLKSNPDIVRKIMIVGERRLKYENN